MHGKRLVALSLCFLMWMVLLVPQSYAQTPSGPAFTALNADVSGTPTQAAAVVAAPVVLTHPGQGGAETINGADTAWMMASTALVLLMTLPGIALFYGGMVRRQSVPNVVG